MAKGENFHGVMGETGVVLRGVFLAAEAEAADLTVPLLLTDWDTGLLTGAGLAFCAGAFLALPEALCSGFATSDFIAWDPTSFMAVLAMA